MKIVKNLKLFIPHFVAVLIFLLVSYIYFFPVTQGKVLHGTDNISAKSQQGEIVPYSTLTGDYCAWTNSAFGGMPAYTVWVKSDSPLSYVYVVINWFTNGGPISYLFIAMISFYILLLCYGVNPWIGIIGSIAYSLSTYFIVIIGAGHITKVLGLAYMPGVFAGIYLVYRKRKLILGATVMALFLALEIAPGHYQIIYYTILIALAMGLHFFIMALKNKALASFFKSTMILVLAAVLAGLTNISSVWTTQEYTPYSARGKNILTAEKSTVSTESQDGLDFEYATQWSYGVKESFNLLIPNFTGGSSVGELSEDSEVYKLFSRSNKAQARQIIKQVPLYWGPQPFTEGPSYMGALAIFLFIFALFYVKTKEKWWVLVISIFALMLAWGNNFEFFNRIIFNYFPLYNKFRAVTTTLIILQFTIPFLGIIALNKLYSRKDNLDFKHALLWALGITGGISLLFALFPGLAGSFSGSADAQYASNQPFIDALIADRKSILQMDALRSLLFVALGGLTLWLFNVKRIGKPLFIISLVLLMILDLAMVDSRYVSHKDFKTKRVTKNSFVPTQADLSIYKMEMLNKGTEGKVQAFLNKYENNPIVENHESKELLALNLTSNYRVLNLSGGINFSDALTSYYHKSLSGYSPAKLRRYQDLIDRGVLESQIRNFARNFASGQNPNSYSLLNMLNTKYVILNNEQPAFYNKDAISNAWFVKSVKWVEAEDEEFRFVTNANPAEQAIINYDFKGPQFANIGFDPQAQISLVDYKPNHLTYNSSAKEKMLAVFTEIYYPKGWQVYIDGEKADHFRANYLFRAMLVPAGDHTIDFKFEPKSYMVGNRINGLVSYLLLFGIFILLIINVLKYKRAAKEIKEVD